MNHPIRRLLVVSLAACLVIGCEPSPAPTGGPPTRATATSPPVSTQPQTDAPPVPSATPQASEQPVAINLPDGFDAIAWADLPPSTGDEDSFTVSIGVLGKPATTTRTFTRQPDIAADGSAVILSDGRSSEIIDGATGTTVATFDHRALELDDVPKRDFSYFLINRRFKTDVARGYLYLLSANRDGVQLRRFALDGSDERLLGIIAPDPGRDPWYVDFVLTPSGDIVATACPFDAERRCRVYDAGAGADRFAMPALLPREAPRPCALFAAGATWVIGTNRQFCRADGGPPTFMPYLAINRSTLATKVVTAPSDIGVFGAMDGKAQPKLVANLFAGYPFPGLYPPIGMVLRIGDPQFTIGPVAPTGGELDTPNRGGPEVWSIAGRGPGWTLFHGYGRAYLACALETERDDRSACPSGPVVLETTKGTFELPAGTWGRVVPPIGSPGI